MSGPKFYEVIEAIEGLLSKIRSEERYKNYESAIQEIISDMQQVPALARQEKQSLVVQLADRLHTLRDDLMKSEWATQIKKTPSGKVEPSTDPLLPKFDEVIRLMRQFAEES